MSLKSLIRIAEDYLRKNPAPTATEIYKGLLKLSYTYTAPATNSKSKREVLYPISDIKQNKNFMQSLTPTLSFDEKTNRLQHSNMFDSISTEEAHEKVLQDAIFGSAKLNKNKDKWIYAAKKKTPKPKSYFLSGSGKSVYAPDLGELYDEVSEVGIFIWDMKLKKIVLLDIKIQGEQSKYVFSYPIFANDEGTKFICHGYKKTEFGHGVSFCFNRPVDIFEVSVENIGQENSKTICKKIIKKHETNIFANISPCYNYILYFGGSDYIHSYYLDLVVLKRQQSTEQNVEEGYSSQWKQIHRHKQAFVGSYFTIKTETFTHNNEQYAYFQTVKQSTQKIFCVNLQSGKIEQVSQGKIGESFSITNFDREQQLVTGIRTGHSSSSFFYFKVGQKPINISPLAQFPITIEQLRDPIHSYYLESQQTDVQFKKQKKPLLVMVHGGPHSDADPCLTLFRYLLMKCGYAMILPNFSGSSGFGQEFMKAAVGNIGKTDAEQIVQTIKNVLKEKQHLDAERVYVYGGSYGGYMGAILGSRYPELFKGAVILNGVISLPGNFWFSDIPQWSTAEALKQSKIHGVTAQDYVKMYQQSPITQPMKVPTLQFLGAKDRRVPYRQGLLFDAMTKKVGTTIQTYVYENSGHSLSDSVETSIDIVLKTMLFLQGLPLVNEVKDAKDQNKEKKQKSEQQKVNSNEKIEKVQEREPSQEIQK